MLRLIYAQLQNQDRVKQPTLDKGKQPALDRVKQPALFWRRHRLQELQQFISDMKRQPVQHIQVLTYSSRIGNLYDTVARTPEFCGASAPIHLILLTSPSFQTRDEDNNINITDADNNIDIDYLLLTNKCSVLIAFYSNPYRFGGLTTCVLVLVLGVDVSVKSGFFPACSIFESSISSGVCSNPVCLSSFCSSCSCSSSASWIA